MLLLNVHAQLAQNESSEWQLFHYSTEDLVKIEATDNSVVVWGRIDILVLKEQLWVLMIESKRAEFSPKVGIFQVLSYTELHSNVVDNKSRGRENAIFERNLVLHTGSTQTKFLPV